MIAVLLSVSFLVYFIAITLIDKTSDPCENELLITRDGNFLFYNAPVATKAGEFEFVAFVSREGEVIVHEYKRKTHGLQFIRKHVIHEYDDVINRKIGTCDDHAAPAIIFDSHKRRLLVATSYHGSSLYIYEHNMRDKGFEKIVSKEGNYTYPRLFQWGDYVYLLVRNYDRSHKAGHLVLLSSKDNFKEENIVVAANENQVIYASRPAVSDEGFFVTYSTLIREENRYKGWKVVQFSLSNKLGGACEVCKEYDLSSHIAPYFSNRPTGIGYNNGQLIVATAFFEKDQRIERLADRFFSRVNRIKIVTLNTKTMETSTIHDNVVTAPYYHTSIDVNNEGDWIYFDKNRVYSSKSINPQSLTRDYLMYPNLTEDAVYYCSVNADFYEIRNFYNSIIRYQFF